MSRGWNLITSIHRSIFECQLIFMKLCTEEMYIFLMLLLKRFKVEMSLESQKKADRLITCMRIKEKFCKFCLVSKSYNFKVSEYSYEILTNINFWNSIYTHEHSRVKRNWFLGGKSRIHNKDVSSAQYLG